MEGAEDGKWVGCDRSIGSVRRKVVSLAGVKREGGVGCLVKKGFLLVPGLFDVVGVLFESFGQRSVTLVASL